MPKYKILTSKETVSEPVISKTIFKTGAQFYISKARVGEWGKELIVEIIGSEEQITDALANLERSGTRVSKFMERVTIDRDLCVDCGACFSLCPWYAIEIKDDWSVQHVPKKCVPGCSLCVSSCPVKAIKTVEIEEE